MVDSHDGSAALSAIAALSDADKELFAQSLDALFSGAFVIRSIEAHERLYKFITANFRLFETYLGFAGWGLKKDEHLGVIAWDGPPRARLTLTKDESTALLIVRILFEEKGADLTLHGQRTILQQEFQDKYRILAEIPLKKTQCIGLLKRLQSLRLIKVLGDEGNPETVILLYPSIPFALEGIAVEELHSRIERYKGSGDSEDASIDESAAETGGLEDG